MHDFRSFVNVEKVMGEMDDIDGGYTTAAERAIQLRNEKEEFKPEEDEISWNSQESGSCTNNNL